MHGRLFSQVYEHSGAAGAAIDDLAGLLVIDARARRRRAVARGAAITLTIGALVAAAAGVDGDLIKLLLVLGGVAASVLWLVGRTETLDRARLEYTGALLHALCPDRAAPVRVRLDLRPTRSSAFHAYDPRYNQHAWRQRWIELDVVLAPGVALAHAREGTILQTDAPGAGGRVTRVSRGERLQGALRYDPARLPALYALGAQLPACAASALPAGAAATTRLAHEPGVVTSVADAAIVDDATAQGETDRAARADLAWLFAVWRAAATAAPWFDAPAAGRLPPEFGRAARVAVDARATALRARAPAAAVAVVALGVLFYGAALLANAARLETFAERYPQFATQAAADRERASEQRTTGLVLLPVGLALAACAVAVALRMRAQGATHTTAATSPLFSTGP